MGWTTNTTGRGHGRDCRHNRMWAWPGLYTQQEVSVAWTIHTHTHEEVSVSQTTYWKWAGLDALIISWTPPASFSSTRPMNTLARTRVCLRAQAPRSLWSQPGFSPDRLTPTQEEQESPPHTPEFFEGTKRCYSTCAAPFPFCTPCPRENGLWCFAVPKRAVVEDCPL